MIILVFQSCPTEYYTERLNKLTKLSFRSWASFAYWHPLGLRISAYHYVQEMLTHPKRCNPRLDILPGLIVEGCVQWRVNSVLADFLAHSSHLRGQHILAANGTKTLDRDCSWRQIGSKGDIKGKTRTSRDMGWDHICKFLCRAVAFVCLLGEKVMLEQTE